MDELPASLDLRVGEERRIPLPGLATAGYRWQDTVDGQAGAVEVGWERGFPEGGAPPAAGANAPETVTVRGVQPGDATLRLALRRPWQAGAPPEREHTIAVHVAAGE
ncbi:MAG TPA: protease inhibitor I42 family protein [Acidimicrobiales bacterium]|nr:protease inhibitor I42 family protein [Acidimicrobiales bacterium]